MFCFVLVFLCFLFLSLQREKGEKYFPPPPFLFLTWSDEFANLKTFSPRLIKHLEKGKNVWREEENNLIIGDLLFFFRGRVI